MKNYLNMNASHLGQKQSGAALFVSLIMLIALTIIGLSAANRSNLQERMASNLHIQNLAFNAAESAIGGVVVDSYAVGLADPANVLEQARANGVLSNICYDSVGNRQACGGVYIDGDKQGAIEARAEVTRVSPCSPSVCGGFTLGPGAGNLGCRVYQIDGTGKVGNKEVKTSLWAYEVTRC